MGSGSWVEGFNRPGRRLLRHQKRRRLEREAAAEVHIETVVALGEWEEDELRGDRFELDQLYLGQDDAVVCPTHLRFIPCRRCAPGQEKYSSDAEDISRTVNYQRGDDTR